MTISIEALGRKGTTDTQLMVDLGAGRESSLNELVRRHQRPLVGYLARIVDDAEKARDLAQETFLRIFRHASGYRTTTRFTTWLYHIARNLARDELRSRRRRPITHSDEAVNAESVESQQHEQDVRELVNAVLAKLPERDQRLLVMRDIKGLSYEDIAAELDMALGTVKSGISRARTRFKEHYEAMLGR